MLRPHAPGTLCRVWDECEFDRDMHEQHLHVDGTILACKYWRWEAGTYGGRNYIQEGGRLGGCKAIILGGGEAV